MRDINIQLSKQARDQFKKIYENGLYPKLVLAKSGCCSYKFDLYPDKLRWEDETVFIKGFDMILDPQVMPFLEHGKLGIHYGKKGLFNGFIIMPI